MVDGCCIQVLTDVVLGYDKLTSLLQQSVFEVHVPNLPSVDRSRPPTADLKSDTAHVRSVAGDLMNIGHTLTVLMHSYGGQIGTNALSSISLSQRTQSSLPGGISHLIYMGAHINPSGRSTIDNVRHFNHEHLMPLAFDFALDMTVLSRDPKMLFIGETNLPDAEVDEYLSTLQVWIGQGMHQPITAAVAAWREIPVTYIHTTEDMTVPYEYQKYFVGGVEKEGVSVQTCVVESGHCANFTAAEDVADVVGKCLVLRGREMVKGRGERILRMLY
ncbi:hypothetical protein EK21DRAFT_98491 [Setomelanomma holmii]|uniref:AB hydrolase-1 domain-containing protein n=1 Tax=Setomelanomma holmii TaxID=210430 RepID=A0A9P4HH79_9PLEO|nr:hypothetical protein EK21DRAFT_98491 [Setomelanomma holmii]